MLAAEQLRFDVAPEGVLALACPWCGHVTEVDRDWAAARVADIIGCPACALPITLPPVEPAP